MSRAAFKADIRGLLPLKQQMAIVAMPRATRRRLIYRVTKRVIRDSKKRARDQVDLKGRPYASRAKKRKGGRKMLTRMAKELAVIDNNSLQATIGFRSPVLARIASKQQHGYIERVTPRKLSKQDKKASDEPATRKQARALREAGFEIRKKKGKGYKKPSLKWITETFTIGQAGAILKAMRIKAGERIKTSWTTVLPARSFLGATALEIRQHIEMIYKQIKQEASRATR